MYVCIENNIDKINEIFIKKIFFSMYIMLKKCYVKKISFKDMLKIYFKGLYCYVLLWENMFICIY